MSERYAGSCARIEQNPIPWRGIDTARAQVQKKDCAVSVVVHKKHTTNDYREQIPPASITCNTTSNTYHQHYKPRQDKTRQVTTSKYPWQVWLKSCANAWIRAGLRLLLLHKALAPTPCSAQDFSARP